MARYELSPGQVAIFGEGISRGNVCHLDIAPDAVVFTAKGQPVRVQLDEGPIIDVERSTAKWKKGRLVICWDLPKAKAAPTEREVNGSGICDLESAERARTEVRLGVRGVSSGCEQLPSPSPAAYGHSNISTQQVGELEDCKNGTGTRVHGCGDASGTTDNYEICTIGGRLEWAWREAVEWSVELLRKSVFPDDVAPVERFKAEVGLGELALYAVRAARCGLPAGINSTLHDTESCIQRALSSLAAGDMSSLSPMWQSVCDAVTRVMTHIRAGFPPLPPAPLLGARPVSANCALHAVQWRLRSGRMIGPGVGTWKLSSEECESRVFASLLCGIRHLDIAAEYGTEAAAAVAMRRSGVPRNDIFVNLKVFGESAEELRVVVQESLARFGGWVDCLMLHRSPMKESALVELWSVLKEERHAGRARVLGASNVSTAQLAKLCRESCKPELVQVKASPFHQGAYFAEDGTSALWSLMRSESILPVGISLLNPLHSSISPLEEPLLRRWASSIGMSVPQVVIGWAVLSGICPILRCSPDHARQVFSTPSAVPPNICASVSALGALSATLFCPVQGDVLRLKQVPEGWQQHVGRLVELWGLKDTKDLNGSVGVLTTLDEHSGRWEVELPDCRRKVKPSNLAITQKEHCGDLGSAGEMLQWLLSAGSVDPMLQRLAERRDQVSSALAKAIECNIAAATERGWHVKVKVFRVLLDKVHGILRDREPSGPSWVGLLNSVDVAWGREGSARELKTFARALQTDGFAIGDGFIDADVLLAVRKELLRYEDDFERAKIWVGKGTLGAEIGASNVRSDRILWIRGGHRTSRAANLYDSTGTQPKEGLAAGFQDAHIEELHTLQRVMRRFDSFVFDGLRPMCPRIAGLVERGDVMISIFDNGERFQKHIDNTTKDGRCLSAFIYLNDTRWYQEDGGSLRIWKADGGTVDALPEGGRAVFLWSNTVPHEVLAACRKRMAMVAFWFDKDEREAHVSRLQELSISSAVSPLSRSEEHLAQGFMADLLSPAADPADLLTKARALPQRPLEVVAGILGAEDAQQALDAIGRLSHDALRRLREQQARMGI